MKSSSRNNTFISTHIQNAAWVYRGQNAVAWESKQNNNNKMSTAQQPESPKMRTIISWIYPQV